MSEEKGIQILCHHLLPRAIQRHGKHTGRLKVNPGVLSLRLTRDGRNILQSDELSRLILSKGSTLLGTSN